MLATMDILEILQHVAARVEHEESAAADTQPRTVVDTTIGTVRCVLVRTPAEFTGPKHAQLSPREQEIARMIGEGLPNKTIARVLDISIWTVGTHLRRLFMKLGVGSRAAMIAKISSNSPLDGTVRTAHSLREPETEPRRAHHPSHTASRA